MGSKIANITAMPPTRMVGSALSSHSSIYNIKKKTIQEFDEIFHEENIRLYIIMTALKM